MYKGLLLLTGFLCACNIMIKAQYEGTTDTVQYTMDKLIPSYLQIKEKGISSPRTTALKARHVGLERLLNLNDETNAILKDTLTDIAGGFHESCVEYYHGIEVEGTEARFHYLLCLHNRWNQIINIKRYNYEKVTIHDECAAIA